jgi:putative phosphoribosyl transferase
VVFAAPVAPARIAGALRAMVDDLVVLVAPRHLHSVGLYYDDFSPVTDDDVLRLLGRAGPGPVQTQPNTLEDSHAVA